MSWLMILLANGCSLQVAIMHQVSLQLWVSTRLHTVGMRSANDPLVLSVLKWGSTSDQQSHIQQKSKILTQTIPTLLIWSSKFILNSNNRPSSWARFSSAQRLSTSQKHVILWQQLTIIITALTIRIYRSSTLCKKSETTTLRCSLLWLIWRRDVSCLFAALTAY